MTRQKQSEPLFPTTETGIKLGNIIGTLLGVAWSSGLDIRKTRDRIVALIRHLEGVEGGGAAVIGGLCDETVDEQYARLSAESALPVAIDSGDEMLVAWYGGAHSMEHPFPSDVAILHRDVDGAEKLGHYEFVKSEDLVKKE